MHSVNVADGVYVKQPHTASRQFSHRVQSGVYGRGSTKHPARPSRSPRRNMGLLETRVMCGSGQKKKLKVIFLLKQDHPVGSYLRSSTRGLHTPMCAETKGPGHLVSTLRHSHPNPWVETLHGKTLPGRVHPDRRQRFSSLLGFRQFLLALHAFVIRRLRRGGQSVLW